MSVFFFLGKPTDFPLAPFFIPELDKAPWAEDFRVISKSAYQIFISEKKDADSSSRRDELITYIEKVVKEKKLIFSEELYLESNPDILQAISLKTFRTGFHHYLAHGIGENRIAEFILPIKVEEIGFSLKVTPSNKIITKSPERLEQCVQVLFIDTYSSIGPAIPYADRKLKSRNFHQIFFCESWLAYDLAWNICQKNIKDSQNTSSYINSTKI